MMDEDSLEKNTFISKFIYYHFNIKRKTKLLILHSNLDYILIL